MKRFTNMLIAGLITVVIAQTVILIDINKKRVVANNAACMMSDIIRLHLDEKNKECWFDDLYCGYVEDFGPLDLDEWVWCY